MEASRRKYGAGARRCILSLLLILAAEPIGGQDFQITDLSAIGCSVVEHDAITGDDRGGIAVSSTHVFYTGDSATGRFDLADLSGGAGAGERYDALASDLSTGAVYSSATARRRSRAPGARSRPCSKSTAAREP